MRKTQRNSFILAHFVNIFKFVFCICVARARDREMRSGIEWKTSLSGCFICIMSLFVWQYLKTIDENSVVWKKAFGSVLNTKERTFRVRGKWINRWHRKVCGTFIYNIFEYVYQKESLAIVASKYRNLWVYYTKKCLIFFWFILRKSNVLCCKTSVLSSRQCVLAQQRFRCNGKSARWPWPWFC